SGEAETTYLASINASGLERRFGGLWRNFGITFIADPALFPAIGKFGSAGAEVIDKIHADGMVAQNFCDYAVMAYGKGGSSIAAGHFGFGTGLRPGFFG